MEEKGGGRGREVSVVGQNVRNVVVDAFHVLAVQHKGSFRDKCRKEPGEEKVAVVFFPVKGGADEPSDRAGVVG